MPYLSKQKMRLYITWSNSDNESEGEYVNIVMAYSRKYKAKSESSNEDMMNEELASTYRLLLNKWEEACMEVANQKKTINGILQEKVKQATTITNL